MTKLIMSDEIIGSIDEKYNKCFSKYEGYLKRDYFYSRY